MNLIASDSRGLIGDVDTLIAALALERNLTVISTDADFERVPGLKLMLVPRRSLEARSAQWVSGNAAQLARVSSSSTKRSAR
jgi:hypothetical protein